MYKKGRVYLVIALMTIGLLLAVQYNRPKELNWFPSFVSQHKIPYGTYVLNEIIQNLFPDAQHSTLPPYQFLIENPEAEGTYFFVDGAVKFEETELQALLEWTSKGNTLFIASEVFDKTLLDTLGLGLANLYNSLGEGEGRLYRLVHPQFRQGKGYPFTKDSYAPYFRSIDTVKSTVLGLVDHLSADRKLSKEHISMVQQGFGKGKVILSTFPKAFTNYFILTDDHRDYTAGLLTYLDEKHPIYVDEYYKSGKSFYASPMYIFLNNKSLKWAYYLSLIGGVMYVIFEGKRKQRAIPIIRPLQNQSLAFTRTIADMYYEKREHKQIAMHKIAYFLEYIRSHFYLSTSERDKSFFRNLAMRSSHTEIEIGQLFDLFDRLESREAISDQELSALNTAIAQFKKRADARI